MSTIMSNDNRRFDDYASRPSFNTPPGYYVQPPYHVSDAAGTDTASCDSSRSPGYQRCSCRSAVEAELSKTPADAGGLSRYFHRYQHHHQQSTSFAIHQLLGLGADLRNLDINCNRQVAALQTAESRHTPPTPCRCADCVQSFNVSDDTSDYLRSRCCRQLDLPHVAAYYRQHHDSTTDAAATKWPYLREPLQMPPLTPWSNGEPHLPKKTVHHQQQEPQHHYDELQAYYCAARLQPPSSVDVSSCNSVIMQCRNMSYLPPNFGTYTRQEHYVRQGAQLSRKGRSISFENCVKSFLVCMI